MGQFERVSKFYNGPRQKIILPKYMEENPLESFSFISGKHVTQTISKPCNHVYIIIAKSKIINCKKLSEYDDAVLSHLIFIIYFTN